MISFSILSHNEGEDLGKLLHQIATKSDLDYEFEIVIVDDFSTDSRTMEILEEYGNADNVHVFQRKLDMDFAGQKNFANSKCVGEYIFSVDADEYFPDNLIANLYELVKMNGDIDLM